MKDDAGRPLANAASFPLKVGTDENPPLVKFAADFGILERVVPGNGTPLLPLTVRNVEPTLAGTVATNAKTGAGTAGAIPGKVARAGPGEDMKIIDWLRRIEIGDKIENEYDQQAKRWILIKHGHAEPIFKPTDAQQAIAVPKPNGAKAFEVVGIPLQGPGFYVVELASPKLGAALLGETKPFYVRAATLVTNLSVHFKLGRESSLVWVTRLSDGKPAKNARVTVEDCSGRKYWEGPTDASGIARVNLELPDRDGIAACGAARDRREFFVEARLGDDMAYAFSDWGEGISPWRFNVPTAHYDGPYVAHAVLDRSLFRAGDTASMKVFVRKQTGEGFATVARKDLGDTLLIRHQGSDREYTVPIRWTGSAHGEASFAIPKDAQLGTYTVNMSDSLTPPRGRRRDERVVGRFRVEAFRIPLMRARLQPVGTPLVNPADVSIDMSVNYLSGGGAGGLPVKLRTQLETKSVAFPDFESYAFAAGDVSEGRDEEGDATANLGDYNFSDPDSDDEDSDSTIRSRCTARRASSRFRWTPRVARAQPSRTSRRARPTS